jgi:hypothetical protein
MLALLNLLLQRGGPYIQAQINMLNTRNQFDRSALVMLGSTRSAMSYPRPVHQILETISLLRQRGAEFRRGTGSFLGSVMRGLDSELLIGVLARESEAELLRMDLRLEQRPTQLAGAHSTDFRLLIHVLQTLYAWQQEQQMRRTGSRTHSAVNYLQCEGIAVPADICGWLRALNAHLPRLRRSDEIAECLSANCGADHLREPPRERKIAAGVALLMQTLMEAPQVCSASAQTAQMEQTNAGWASFPSLAACTHVHLDLFTRYGRQPTILTLLCRLHEPHFQSLLPAVPVLLPHIHALPRTPPSAMTHAEDHPEALKSLVTNRAAWPLAEGNERWRLWAAVLEHAIQRDGITQLSSNEWGWFAQTRLQHPSAAVAARAEAAAALPAAAASFSPAAASSASAPVVSSAFPPYPPSLFLVLRLLHSYGMLTAAAAAELTWQCIVWNRPDLLRWWLSGERRAYSVCTDWAWPHLRSRVPLMQSGSGGLAALDEAISWWHREAQPALLDTLQRHLIPDVANIVLDYVQAAPPQEFDFAAHWRSTPETAPAPF